MPNARDYRTESADWTPPDIIVRDRHGAVVGEVRQAGIAGWHATFRGKVIAGFMVQGRVTAPRDFASKSGAVAEIRDRWARANLTVERPK